MHLALVLVTPGATAFTLIPEKDVSNAVHLTSILSIDIDVDNIADPAYGVSPALLERTVMVPFANFKNGVARDMN